MSENILNGSRESLIAYRDLFKTATQQSEQLEVEKSTAKHLEKEISQAKKSMKDNEESTVKKRRAEVAAQFDSEISKESKRLQKAQSERGKAKAVGVQERITAETAELSVQNEELKKNIKAELKAEKLPHFAGGSYFFTLYFTKGFGEVMLCILTLLIVAAGLPNGVYFLLKAVAPALFEKVNPYVIYGLCYAVILVIAFFLYLIIGENTKHKHNEKLREIRGLRDAIRANKKQMRRIARAIQKDKNEEMYGLGDYDEKIASSEGTISRIGEDKDAALKTFDEETKPSIIAEIENREMPHIEDLENKLAQTQQTIASLEESVKQNGLTLSTQYEAYLGKEYNSIAKIDALLEVMDAGEAQTVGEAVNVLKNRDAKN